MTHNARLAQHYAAAGYAVLPVSAATKSPTIKGGFKSASTDPEQIDAWWRQWPSALPALATGSFWVLDVDHKTDGSHASSAPILNRIGLGCAVRSAGLIVHTARGGAHLYFGRTPGVAVPPRACDIAPGIDTRGHDENGVTRSYIVAPGSVRPDGATYRIASGALDEIGQASKKLLAAAHFNRRERDVITATSELRAALCAAPADCWRAF